MAYIGLRNPYIGARKEDGKYETPFQLGKAVSLNITPNFAEGSLYANDGLAEYDKEFTNADVTLGTSTIPVEAQKPMFGHTVETTGSKKGVTYNQDDQSGYVGFGFISVEKVNGVRSFVAAFLPKVKFTEPSDDYETKGESITYKTPSITGKATADDDGVWKETDVFATEAEAVSWITGKFTTAA